MMNYLQHHGIKGQKWGIRRYQNEDGSLTTEGKRRRNDHLTIQRNSAIMGLVTTGMATVAGYSVAKMHDLNPTDILNGKRLATAFLYGYGMHVLNNEIHYKRTGEVRKL